MRFIFRFQALVVVAAVAQITACGEPSGPRIGPPARVVLVAGDAQVSPEVGTRLPLPLTIKVIDAQGRNVSDATVVWSAASGSLSAPTSRTNFFGVASIEWTLGPLAGAQTATATVTGIPPVTFTQQASAGPPTQLILSRDTVQFLGIGDTFRMTARPADRFGNFLAGGGSTIESADPSIVTAANFGNGAFLTARTSNATTTIRASAGSLVKIGTVIVLPPPCQPGSNAFNLAVGEIATLSGAAASEFCVQGTPAGAEFTAIPFYSNQAGSLLRFSISTGGTTIGAAPSRIVAPRFEALHDLRAPRLRRDETFEVQLREKSHRELTPLIPLARLTRQHSGGRLSFSVRAPQVGDLLQLNTNPQSACTNPQIRTGRVAAITSRAIVVADTTNPSNGFTDEDFQFFGVTFDTLIYPVNTQNFGDPTDIDGNQRVILFFTRAVNELTPPNQNSYVGGYFFSRDLFPKTATSRLEACAASNIAEIFYLLVPDPQGVVNQNERTTSFVRTVTTGVVAHEFQHLINASRRLYVNTGSSVFEELFLDEGLAHIAEELTFYRASGLTPKQNISAASLNSSQKIADAFESFGIANMRRYREFLADPLTNSPYADDASITTRGAIWSFLRYAVDRHGAPESSIWFQLVNPPPGSRGLANLSRVFGPDLISWIRDWAIANYADDFVAGVPAVGTHPSWDSRTVVAALNGGNFPLESEQIDNASTTSIAITDGSSTYLRFGVLPGAVGGGRIIARGAPVPPEFTLSILRTK